MKEDINEIEDPEYWKWRKKELRKEMLKTWLSTKVPEKNLSKVIDDYESEISEHASETDWDNQIFNTPITIPANLE